MSSARRSLSLRHVLAMVHMRVTLFAISMAIITISLIGFATILRYAEQNQDLVAETASYVAAPAIVFRDPAVTQAIIAPLLSRRCVARIDVLVDGKPFASTNDPRRAPSNFFERQLARYFFLHPHSRLIEHQGQTIGEIQVFIDVEEIAEYVLTALVGGLSCLLLTAIATALLARRLSANVVQPLEAISQVAHRVRSERCFDLRAPSASIHEIDALGADFNSLIAEMERWDTRLRTENEELSHRATHDSLTQLPNRRAFEWRLGSAIAEAGRANQTFAVMFIDGDHFKDINDQLGHRSGDAVLMSIADRLARSIQPEDTAARLGGDEFAVILAPPTNGEGVDRVLEDIKTRMSEPVCLPDGNRITISVSVGVAIFPQDGRNSTELLARADAAMYAYKSRTRQIGKQGRR